MQRDTVTNVTCLGFSSFIAQVVLLREFLHVFAGNELLIGVFLAVWLTLTGLGALAGARHAPSSLTLTCLMQGLAGIVLPVSAIALRIYRGSLGNEALPGPVAAFLIAVALLAPFCLLSGALLARFATAMSPRGDAGGGAGRVYAWDSGGGLIGGLILTFVLFGMMPPVNILIMLGLANLATATLSAWRARRRGLSAGLTAVALLMTAVAVPVDFERLSARLLYPDYRLLERTVTPYGTLDVVNIAGQTTVFATGAPIASTANPAQAEEAVHFALAQHPRPESVLLISGGLEGAVAEAVRYPLTRLDYVEADPAVLELADRLRNTRGIPVLREITADARQWVASVEGEYDAVLTVLPPPETMRINRYYTTEFFALLRRALLKDGVMGLVLPGMENYADPRLKTLHSSVYSALRQHFGHVLVIPGWRSVFIASDRPLSADIGALLKERGITTKYVNDDYLAARLTGDRMTAAENLARAEGPPNRDFSPVAITPVIARWLETADSSPAAFIPQILLALALVFGISASSPRPGITATLASSGFSAMVVEVALFAGFQALHGSLYRHLAVLLAAFMGGSALGSALGARAFARGFTRADLGLGLAALGSAAVLWISGLSSAPAFTATVPLFALLIAVTGFFSSFQIPTAARLWPDVTRNTAGRIIAAELAGAALGAFAGGVWLAPTCGVIPTLAGVGVIKLVTATLLSATATEQRAVTTPSASGRAGWPFAVMLAVLALVGVFSALPTTLGAVYYFSFTRWYQACVVFIVMIEMARAAGIRPLVRLGESALAVRLRRITEKTFSALKLPAGRWLGFVILALAGFLPLFRCYFKIPYLFCHVCPRQCAFGVFRPWLVPCALVMNLEKQHWCRKVCPIGTLYHGEAVLRSGSRRLSGLWRLLPALALTLVAVAYFRIAEDRESPPGANDWFTALFHNAYLISAWTVAVVILLVAAGFRLNRPFCVTLCPIGAVSDFTAEVGRKLFGKGPSTTSGPATTDKEAV